MEKKLVNNLIDVEVQKPDDKHSINWKEVLRQSALKMYCPLVDMEP